MFIGELCQVGDWRSFKIRKRRCFRVDDARVLGVYTAVCIQYTVDQSAVHNVVLSHARAPQERISPSALSQSH